jgi:hypothetical protein
VRRFAARTDVAAVAACLLLALSFYALQRWLERGTLADTPVYEHYAGLVRGGQVPYRDFRFEYPPAALPALLVPSWFPWSYATSFAVLTGALGAGCIAAAAAVLRSVAAGAVRTWAALLLIGVSPLVLGSLFDTRYDLWPALLAIAGVALLVRERTVTAGAVLGLGFAAKLWPGVLLPLAAAYLWQRRGRGDAAAVTAAFAVVALACFLPFVALSPGGVAASLRSQLQRPLQVESLGAAVLMAAQHLGMRPLATIDAGGGQALSGRGAGLAADLSTALELASVAGVWLVFWLRRIAEPETLLAAAGGAVAALVAFDKVLSPQYLIWLVPLVAVVRGARGVVSGILLLGALGLTQTWFPWSYWQLALGHASPWSWYLLARNLALVALAGVLLAELIPARGYAGGTADWPDARRAAA